MTTIFAKPPPGRPDLRRRLRIELADQAINSRVVVTPGPDDWFGETDISQFITNADLEARVGETTKAYLECVLVEAVTDEGAPPMGVFTPPRFWNRLRVWRIALTRGAA